MDYLAQIPMKYGLNQDVFDWLETEIGMRRLYHRPFPLNLAILPLQTQWAGYESWDFIGYTYDLTSEQTRPKRGFSVPSQVQFIFKNEADAVKFKLRWG